MKRLLASLFIFPLTAFAAFPTAPYTTPDAQLPDGGKYYGHLENGVLSGEGLILYPNGKAYKGVFKDGVLEGQGETYAQHQLVYKGTFHQGDWDGLGTLTALDGSTYVGEFKDGLVNGKGTLTQPDKFVYTGDFKNKTLQGKGRYESADGKIYEGDFVNNEFTGQGKLTLKDEYFEGSFTNFRPNGVGKYHSDAYELEGNFNNSRLNGQGKFHDLKTNDRYEGSFTDSKFEGYGKLYYGNGDIYEGNFYYGERHGKGKLILAKPNAKGQTTIAGEWVYGEYSDPAEEKRQLTQLETAIYQQQHLLDQSLNAVKPSIGKGIQLFWLGIAGDGKQEVFHREVDFVRQQFEKYFGVKDHAISLINSRNTFSDAPFATKTSISASLKAIRNKMDPQKDILFLFMTSHGSQDHFFSLAQEDLRINDLSSKDLASVLKQSGIQWKVLVISACYSGGFINDLKDDHTLILTAARADRTSFGCSDTNDFTYFGKAFFKESLTPKGDFIAAFQKAKGLIRSWETTDNNEATSAEEKAAYAPSEPQLFIGKAIAPYLKKWATQLPSNQ
ncbi:hypothetical protein LIN78_10890 [Leeia sp. TBRC 13508]|uniref:Peptidase C13 n=1 Tax=Leeia speluncae TaxID=2884804 RepID=A0ABS8D771_9NEIS|nr:C13 family peptidase [Leeia speluncae]MCB6184051.1 hypothetical protein [Leeia speluncae]